MPTKQDLSKWRERRDAIKRLYSAGWTFARIAKRYRISRERARQVVRGL